MATASTAPRRRGSKARRHSSVHLRGTKQALKLFDYFEPLYHSYRS